jgi:hypothetical protein
MALEIKATPVLTGQSAADFISLVDRNKHKRESIARIEALKKQAREALQKAKI